jgi:hypothetical protein
MTWNGNTWHGLERQGTSWHGMENQGKAGHDMTWKGMKMFSPTLKMS